MLGIFQSVGFPELVIILAVLLLLFGATRIPTLARSLGKSVKEFKKGTQEGEEDEKGTGESKPESSEEKK